MTGSKIRFVTTNKGPWNKNLRLKDIIVLGTKLKKPKLTTTRVELDKDTALLSSSKKALTAGNVFVKDKYAIVDRNLAGEWW